MQAISKVRNVCLFGASPDTGNRGVTALCHSVIWHLHSRNVNKITVFDHGRGQRPDQVVFGNERVTVNLRGAVHSRRLYRTECLWTIRMATWLNSRWNSAAHDISEADAVYDVSAGDSFTDLYGERRFRSVVLPKLIALEAGRPLVLLPQTYGPFRSPEARATAEKIVRQSRMAWARDADSFAALKELLGDAFDPARHRQGVDMAFALPAIPPRNLSPKIQWWLSPEERRQHEVVGLNISGLIYNDPIPAAEQFGLKANYPLLVHEFLDWLLQSTDVRVILVPHVTTRSGEVESDPDAVQKVYDRLSPEHQQRVAIAEPESTPSELKWLIGQTAWFCGTRMHSTIAGLGSGVPTAAVSYSLKTRGVFATCGQGHQVFELRYQDTAAILASLKASFLRRQVDRELLAKQIPAVTRMARNQLDEIFQSITTDKRQIRSS
ncbi:MAG: polysaccharide pyruvyl transferase family protein [Planctomycetota bacterium]|nr:MAG: polysaccharide pyruvyl transferase family protein [Planctomycetota bacterium]